MIKFTTILAALLLFCYPAMAQRVIGTRDIIAQPDIDTLLAKVDGGVVQCVCSSNMGELVVLDGIESIAECNRQDSKFYQIKGSRHRDTIDAVGALLICEPRIAPSSFGVTDSNKPAILSDTPDLSRQIEIEKMLKFFKQEIGNVLDEHSKYVSRQIDDLKQLQRSAIPQSTPPPSTTRIKRVEVPIPSRAPTRVHMEFDNGIKKVPGGYIRQSDGRFVEHDRDE